MSEALKIRWVGLVRPDDPEYLAAMSAQALAHRHLGPRQDPGEIYRASSLAETAVRAWLGARLPLLEERVVVADLLPHGKRAYERRYLELDAVEGRDGAPSRIIEVKFSANPASVRRGLTQLGRARALLGQRWDGPSTLLVLVEANRSGVEVDLERLRGLRLVAADELGDRDGPGPSLLVLPLAALTSHLSAAEMAALERGRDEGQGLTDRRQEREAAAAAGQPVAELGSAGAIVDRRMGPAATLTFGDDTDDAEDSPFAALRRRASNDDEGADR